MYFENLPNVYYDLVGQAGVSPIITKNIMSRAKIRQAVLDNTLVQYTYTVRDGETPEIIAAKYYDDPNKHWIVLLANQIIDPHFDWPMNSDAFGKYIDATYGSFAAAQALVHHYEKIVTTIDSFSSESTVNTYVVDYNTYVATIESTNSYAIPGGSSVKRTVTKQAVDHYTWELARNEARRQITLIDKQYAGQIEAELEKLYT
jgi:hypothetical protein